MTKLDKLANFPDEFMGTEKGWALQGLQLDLAVGINRATGKVLRPEDVWNRVMQALGAKDLPDKKLD